MSEETIVDKTPEKKEEVNPRSMSSEDLKSFSAGKEAEEKTEDKTDESKDKDEEKKEETLEEKVKRLEKIVASKTKQAEDRQKFIDVLDDKHEKKVTNLQSEIERLKKVQDETTSVAEATRAQSKIEKNESTLDQLKVDRVVAVNKEDTLTALPDFEEKMPAMKEILKEEGFNEQTIKEFEAQPYVNDPVLLKQIYRSAKSSEITNALNDEIKKLKAEQEELKKKPDKLFDTIEKAANRKSVTASSGGTPDKKGQTVEIDRKTIAGMTKEELRELQKRDN